MIYATAKKDRAEWDSVIWKVLLGLRASKSGTKFSPFEVFYGFNPRLDTQQFKIENAISISEIRSEIRAKNEKKIKRLNNEFLYKFKEDDMLMIR